MKCPNCRAEINSGKFCEFCGSQITSEMRHEQEQLNKKGCPKCGSSNVNFNREKQGEIKNKQGTAIVRTTVGICKDCGYTWQVEENASAKKRKTWLWVLGWVFIFPLPLTILLVRNKKMNPVVKYGIIAVAWIICIFIGVNGNSTKKTSNVPTYESAAVVSSEITETDSASQPSEIDSVPREYQSALAEAETYSSVMHLSKALIYDMLVSEYGGQFSEDAAQYAIDNLVADWNANALATAEDYATTMQLSKAGIYDQLISEFGDKFTSEEAQYAIDNIEVDWKANALAKAKSYQETMNRSSNAIYDQLISEYGEKFTAEEAQYAIDNLN